MIDKINDYCHNFSGTLVIWGVSSYLGRVVKSFKANGIDTICLIDSDNKKWGYKYCGVECERPADAIKNYPDAYFFVAAIHNVDDILGQMEHEFNIPSARILNRSIISDNAESAIVSGYIYTDAVIYDEDIASELSKGKMALNVSINAGTKDTYEFINGADNFDAIVSNLKKYAACGNGEFIHLNYSFIPDANDYNGEIIRFVELVKELRSEMVIISYDSQYDEVSPQTYGSVCYLIGLLKNENVAFEISSILLKQKLYRLAPNRTPKAFVFTCAYNAEKTIARTIESVLNQSFVDFNYYVVNNGSTDNTGSIIMDYARTDARVYMIQVNHNDLRNHVTIARTLARSSSAKYFTRLDADDVMHEDFLKIMISYADENGCDIVACGYNKIDADTGEIITTKQSDENFVVSGNKFRDDFIKYRGYLMFAWGKLINIDYNNRTVTNDYKNKVLRHYDDTANTMMFIHQSNRFGVVGKPLIDYFINKNALTFNLTQNIYYSYMDLYLSNRYFIESRGKLSADNENFLHCIYLSIIEDIVNIVLNTDKMTSVEKNNTLCSILANHHTREVFSCSIDTKFHKLTARFEWLVSIAEKIKDNMDVLPLIDDLKQAEKIRNAETLVFEHEYKKILADISTSPYIRQLSEIRFASANRPVILYGAGKAVGIVLVVCKKCGLSVTALCDSNRTGTYENGGVSLPIISPDELVENYANSSLIVTSWKFENEIRENLKSIGFNSDNIFSFWYPQRITPEIFENDFYAGYKWAYHFYKDELSKQLVLDKIRNYLTSSPLEPNTKNAMYYEDVINLGNEEIFLDAGAYDGDTVKDFVKKVGGKYKYIYAFEPDSVPFKELSDYVEKIDNAEAINAGLGGGNSIQKFRYGGLVASGFIPLRYFATCGTKFTDTEFMTDEKEVFSIDSLINSGKMEFLPTFIKLDVEGYEAGVLAGATNLIRTHKPKLAICAYHQINDIYAIPKTILRIRNDYKFVLRQHDYGYYETILYAY